jgi:hypothetical protein
MFVKPNASSFFDFPFLQVIKDDETLQRYSSVYLEVYLLAKKAHTFQYKRVFFLENPLLKEKKHFEKIKILSKTKYVYLKIY